MAPRLFTVIAVALLMGLVFGGLRVADAENSASQFGQVAQLANLSARMTALVNDLQNERDETVKNLTSDDQAPLQPLYAKTNTDLPPVVQELQGIGGAFPANIQGDSATVLADLTGTRLGQLHSMLSPKSPQSETSVIDDYSAVIDDMITLEDQVGQGVSDASLTSDVRALNELSLAKEQVSQQRAVLNFAFENPDTGQNNAPIGYTSQNVVFTVVVKGNAEELNEASPFFDPSQIQDLQTGYDQEFVDESGFQQAATFAERTYFSDMLGTGGQTPAVSLVENIEQNAIAEDNAVAPPNNGAGTVPGAPILDAIVDAGPSHIPASNIISTGLTAWDTGMTDKLNAMQSTETLLSGNIVNRAAQLHNGAQESALLSAVITALVLLVVLVAALFVARSLVLPLRRLRAGALDIASVQLPERVRLLSDNPESAATMSVEPINVASQDEIGQVARAFDQVHAEAVRLAGEQALLRSSFNAMFVNLSRRSQSLIERLARMIDNLEQNEDDPDRLGSLFSMDHLVTRMRRNSENLLLLAGHENPRKWSDSVPLADIARAATSEIEQYNRITLHIPPGISVIGQAVSDVVHLLAELIENATIFSPKDTQVLVAMQELTSGGVLIEVIDKGIGVSDARLTEMNWRLDNPPTIDVSVSRHMGLFAVARLAERHRVRVRLRPATPQGLSALVWLPDGVIERVGLGPTANWSARPVAARARTGENVALAQAASVSSGSLGGSGSGSLGGSGSENGGGYGSPESRTPSGWFRGGQVGARLSPAGDVRSGQHPGISPDWGEVPNPAEMTGEPASVDQTIAGLPVRVPKANLTSGNGGTPDSQGAGPGRAAAGNGRGTTGNGSRSLPQRSPEHARSRLTGFQRGTRRAEAQGGSGSQAPRAGDGTIS